MKLKDLKKRDGSGAWPGEMKLMGSLDPDPTGDKEASIYNHAVDELGSLNLGINLEKMEAFLLTMRSIPEWQKALLMKDRLSEWLVVEEAKK